MKILPQGRRGAETQRKILCCFVALLLSGVLFANVSAQNEPIFEDLFITENATLLEELPIPMIPLPVQLPDEAAYLPSRNCGSAGSSEVSAANVSPDGRYTVFFDCLNRDVGVYNIYSLDNETGGMSGIGQIHFFPETLVVERWLDETRFALQASQDDAGTYGTRYLFVGDVTESGSLKEIGSQYVLSPRFEDNPPRYLWVTTVDDASGTIYGVHMYDVATEISAIFFSRPCIEVAEFGCATVTAHPNDSYTFGDATRFALLFSTPLSLEPKLLEVYEAFNQDLIYSTELTDSGRVEWLDANRLLLFNVSIDLVSGTSNGRLVDTSGASPTETDIERIYPFESLSPDREWLLVWAVGPDDGAVNVRNLETGEETPLFRPSSDYTALLGWDENETHTVLARIQTLANSGIPDPVGLWRIGLNGE